MPTRAIVINRKHGIKERKARLKERKERKVKEKIMGWDATYMDEAPTTAERKKELIYNLTYTNDKFTSVALKATMRGNTGFALQEVTDNNTGKKQVFPVAMLTSYRDGQYMVKYVDPIIMYTNFPITWVDKVTPQGEEHAKQLVQWRDAIEDATIQKKRLANLPEGSVINTKFYGELTLKIYGTKRYWVTYDKNGNVEGYIPTRRFGTHFNVVKANR